MRIQDLKTVNRLAMELATAKNFFAKARDNTGTEGVRVWIDGSPQSEEVVAQVRAKVGLYWHEKAKSLEHDLKQFGVEL
ncbi:hypothetical protein XccvBFoX4_gp55c [Xanthomonas phage FoX4]|uniref:Uncharacterized protein n=1 Tax=Xanthomonas phage FoX4 TaxID=2723900 RepID=A0A858WJA0_9CAUD|nr:hypothetical protein KNU97_gp55 [Xanthomonas phage FoX4]QJI53009.1 hypothetical protein XccvBFoX4_gp55c [Xanthomonas phage FoX4]